MSSDLALKTTATGGKSYRNIDEEEYYDEEEESKEEAFELRDYIAAVSSNTVIASRWKPGVIMK